VPDSSFSLAKISFGDILTPSGVVLMLFGFGAYFQLIPGADLSGVALIYGFPAILLGFALKYAQLEPVPCATTRAAFEARDTQMTDNLKQVREDTTRFRCAPARLAFLRSRRQLLWQHIDATLAGAMACFMLQHPCCLLHLRFQPQYSETTHQCSAAAPSAQARRQAEPRRCADARLPHRNDLRAGPATSRTSTRR
jgi:Protein of unknown function (DUF2854)